MWASLQPHYSLNQRRHGFTIVELLIVVVVIAILAAITIVAYTGIQNRAKASAAQQSVTQANKKVLAYAITNSDQYPVDLTTAGISDGDTSYQYSVNNTSSPKTYCITATNSTFSYYLSSTMSSPASGACPGHGANGVVAITNLATNPSFEVSASGIVLMVGGSFARTPIALGSGAYALKITTPGSASAEGVGMDQIPITSFGNYNLAMTGWGVGTINYWIRLWYTDGTYTEGTRGTAVFTSSAQRFNILTTFPDNGKTINYATVYFRTPNLQSDVFYIDSVMITSGTGVYNYADGSSANWVWNGATGTSTSTGQPI